MKKNVVVPSVLLVVCMQTACSPEVGSDAWCEDMHEKPRGDWTANDAAEFAKSCVFKDNSKE